MWIDLLLVTYCSDTDFLKPIDVVKSIKITNTKAHHQTLLCSISCQNQLIVKKMLNYMTVSKLNLTD